MILELTKAIADKYDGSGALVAANTGGLHLGLAPEGTEMPYTNYTIIYNTPSWTFQSTLTIEDAWCQFTVFSATSSIAEVGDIAAKLEAAFDNVSLTYTGGVYSHLHCKRLGGDIVTKDDLGNWQVIIDYMIAMQK